MTFACAITHQKHLAQAGRSLGAVRGVQWTFSIHSAYLLKSQSENKKFSWSVWNLFNFIFQILQTGLQSSVLKYKALCSQTKTIFYFCNNCIYQTFQIDSWKIYSQRSITIHKIWWFHLYLDYLLKGAWSFLFSFFSKLLRFWYHKNCHIFLIIILKFHALIPLRLEENCKNSPILLIWW